MTDTFKPVTQADLTLFKIEQNALIAASSEEHLRDRIAIAALQGILARAENNFDPKSEVAAQCYFYADAMLEARKI